MKKAYDSLQKKLLAVGLSDKEANVYLALLEIGKGTVSQIARRANINRTTGYVILDSLASKRMVSILGKEPKEEYMAESPEKIRAYVENELNKKKEELELIEELVPQLKGLHNLKKRAQVRFYEGREGLKEVYEDTLTSHETIRAFASVEDTQASLPHYFPGYYKRRAAKKIPIRAIFPNTPAASELIKRNRDELRESVLIPTSTFNFSPEINIYDNKVMVAAWQEKLGIIIESQEIADSMKKIFELAWLGAKTLGTHQEGIRE